MYEIIQELLDAIWSTMEPVGYAEDKIRFSGEEFHKYWELSDKYGDQDPDEIIRQAKATIEEAIDKYHKKVGQ